MDIEREEVIHDPVTGSSAATRTSQHVASGAEVQAVKAERTYDVVWYIVGLINTILALRIIFLLLGAKNTGFASFLYSITKPFATPFQGIFASPGLDTGYFDTASLVAIIIYGLIGWGITALLDIAKQPRTT